ncbi:DNA-binding protein [Oceanicaulis alexandrii]|mgnify:CR=1 FL=1|uniref:DNA-binding protein n=1 Tax=Oceanicaulis alexandrii TaxID=153233 RepID=UPI003B5015F7
MSPSDDDKSQSEKFKRLARELECDESEERFDRALKRVAESPPPVRDDKLKKDKPAK